MSEFSAEDNRFMAEALRLAELGLYTTDPNPRVGAVVVKDGKIVGQGFHKLAGEPHAEVLALKEAGAAAKGATLYVTLEPCAHQGKTPPCADAVVASGVSRVVAAMTDPNPLVAGKGFEKLKAAGIRTEEGLMQAQAKALNPRHKSPAAVRSHNRRFCRPEAGDAGAMHELNFLIQRHLLNDQVGPLVRSQAFVHPRALRGLWRWGELSDAELCSEKSNRNGSHESESRGAND